MFRKGNVMKCNICGEKTENKFDWICKECNKIRNDTAPLANEVCQNCGHHLYDHKHSENGTCVKCTCSKFVKVKGALLKVLYKKL